MAKHNLQRHKARMCGMILSQELLGSAGSVRYKSLVFSQNIVEVALGVLLMPVLDVVDGLLEVFDANILSLVAAFSNVNSRR